MNQNHFWNLLAKKLSGEASADELSELESLVKSYPELSFPAQHITDIWKMKNTGSAFPETEEAFQKHLQKLQAVKTDSTTEQKQHDRHRNLSWLLATAICLLLAGAGWYVFKGNEEKAVKPLSQKAEITTRQGARTKLVLPDSSVVWLNAGSRLTYEPDFGNSNRNTTLTGEAFFEVKKSAVPFIIQAAGVHIKVLGTAFNVKSYPNEQTTETSLLRGRVEITLDKRPGEPIILKPNEKLIVSNRVTEEKKNVQNQQPIVVLKELTHVNDSLVAETSWVQNKLVFVDEPFESIAQKMERRYGVDIVFKNEGLKEEKLTGAFEKESVAQALQALQIAVHFHFTQKENTIVLTR